MPVVMSQIGSESRGLNSIFANKRNWGEILGAPPPILSSISLSYFFECCYGPLVRCIGTCSYLKGDRYSLYYHPRTQQRSTKMRVKPKSCDKGGRKNDAFTHG